MTHSQSPELVAVEVEAAAVAAAAAAVATVVLAVAARRLAAHPKARFCVRICSEIIR